MSEPLAASSRPDATVSFDVNTVTIKLLEFWTDNACVWFAQTEALFAIRGVTSSLTKFYYCVATLTKADAAQVVDLIEYPPEEELYESLKARLAELHTLNPFQRYQALMSLTLAVDKKPSTLMGKMCSLLPLDYRVHKTQCFIFKGFFLSNLPPTTRTHLMREDIKDLWKLVAKSDEIWQSASDWSINVVSTASLPVPVQEDADLNALRQCPTPSPAPRPAPEIARSAAPPSSQNSDPCWYYRNHGDQAQRCGFPCSWVP